MTTTANTLARVLCFTCLGLAGCKDDSPCDEGQELRYTGCYPVTVASSAGAGAGDDTPAGVRDGGAESDTGPVEQGVQAEVGQPCADTTASSDCGGNAPICAPLPAGSVCTQIRCLDGEANAGACPAGWTCVQARPLPDPSVCLNF